MDITTYDPATGELGAVRTGCSIEVLEVCLGEGQPYVEGAWAPAFYKVDLETGEVVEKSPDNPA